MAAPESDRLHLPPLAEPPYSISISVAPSNEAKLNAHRPDAGEPSSTTRPQPTLTASSEEPPRQQKGTLARTDSTGERDRRFDQFKTLGGRLERQLSSIRVGSQPPHPDPPAVGDDDKASSSDSGAETDDDVGGGKVPTADRYFAALEGPELETLRATEVPVLPSDETWPFLLRFPISAFGMCMGVSSQAMLWKTLEKEPSTAFLRVSPAVNDALWWLSAVLMALWWLFVATPSVASVAWARIGGEFGLGARLAYYVSLFLYASLVARAGFFFRGVRFSLAWWAYTFLVTSAAIATVVYASAIKTALTQALAVVLSAVASVTVAGVLATTVYRAFVRRDLFPNDVSIAIRRRPKAKFGTILRRLRTSSADLKELVVSRRGFGGRWGSEMGSVSDSEPLTPSTPDGVRPSQRQTLRACPYLGPFSGGPRTGPSVIVQPN